MDENTAMFVTGLVITATAAVMLALAIFSIGIITMGVFGGALMALGRRRHMVLAQQQCTTSDSNRGQTAHPD